MKVSVIVPVYNAEIVLHHCVDSILAQTYKDFELILVDDGSTDGSREICEKYANRNNNVKAVYIENSGVSKARNTGISQAKGEYICFVDSDDYVEHIFLEELIKKTDEGYNFVLTTYQWVSDYERSAIKTVSYPSSDYSVVSKDDLMDLGSLVLLSQPWNKIFKRDIILENNIRMPEDMSLGEDTVFVYRYLSCIISEKFAVINKPLYYYYSNNNQSLLNKYRDDLFEVNKKLNRYLFEEVKKWDLSEEQKQLFYNGCYYRMENVIFNTFRKENSLSKKEKIEYNSNVIKSNEFQYWYKRNTNRINPYFKFSYIIKSSYPIYFLMKMKGEQID